MKMTLANEITFARIILIAPFVICMIKINEPGLNSHMRYMALIILVIMAASDALDGYIARTRQEVTKLGSFLDPLADKLLMLFTCILLATPKTAIENFVLPPTIVVLVIGKDILLLLGFLISYVITSHIHIVPVFAGKAGTAIQLSMVAAVLLAPDIYPVFKPWWFVVRVLWWATAALAAASTFIYIRRGIRYIEEYEAQSHAKK